MFTKEMVQERITKVQAEMEQTKANFAKLEGHLSEALHWLAELTKREDEAKEADCDDVNEQEQEQPTQE